MSNTVAMTENRVNWKAAGVYHTSILLPGPYREYMKGLISFLNGMLVMELVEQHDETVLESFSDKQPRLPFTREELIIEMSRESDDGVIGHYQDLIKYMDQRVLDQEEGKIAADKGNVSLAQYHFARDYALSYLIRGAYKMIQERKKGGAFPAEVML